MYKIISQLSALKCVFDFNINFNIHLIKQLIVI